MAKHVASFTELEDLLQQVSNEETALALDVLRRRDAGLSLNAYPPHLVRIVSQVPDEAVRCFTALLNLRTLQMESAAAPNRSEARCVPENTYWALD